MQNNTDQMNKTREIPTSASNEKTQDAVHENQQSLFDAEDAFSESMLVEKNEVEINSDTEKTEDNTTTAVFDIPQKDISAKELQDSAKGYFDANHSDSIEEKVNELCRLADKGFDDEDTGNELDELLLEKSRIVIDEKKKKKIDRKLRRKGVIPDNDIELLENVSADVFKNEQKDTEPVDDVKVWEADESLEVDNTTDKETDFSAQDTSDGIEYKNPLGTQDDEEDDDENEDDDTLIKALGGSKKHFKSFEAVFGDDEPETEYTDRSQEPSILSGLRRGAIFSAISVVLTLLLTAVCFYFEFAAGTKLSHPSFLEAGKFGVTYSMCMLQLMFLCIILNLDGAKRAFRGLRHKKAAAEGFCAATIIVCTLHSILSAVIAADNPELRSFCSLGCFSILFLSINSFIKAHTSLTSFCIAASKAPKLSSLVLDNGCEEERAFEKYIDKDTTVITVEKSDFVDGFFKKCMASPKASRHTLKIVIITVIAALVTGAVSAVFNGLYFGICAFTTVCLAAFPANALISTALPFFVAASKSKKTQTAFIGEAACDTYENAGVISFNDTEVFPPKSVKVSSIRTYSDNRIDKVILYMARIFDKTQGPLSFVFANSVQSLEQRDMNVSISEHFSNGISAKVDSKEVLVGTDNFMKLYGIETPLDNIDESFQRSLGSIMYMSVDGKLAAKFYIKYTMSRGFEPILRAFYDAGICVGIKTCDPCINNEIVCGNLKGSNYPVSVIKNCAVSVNKNTSDRTEGAVISLSSVTNFLKGFVRLDNLRNIYRSNTTISIFSACAGIVLAAFMCITGFYEIGIASLAMYQLLWCIPTILFSLLSKK